MRQPYIKGDGWKWGKRNTWVSQVHCAVTYLEPSSSGTLVCGIGRWTLQSEELRIYWRVNWNRSRPAPNGFCYLSNVTIIFTLLSKYSQSTESLSQQTKAMREIVPKQLCKMTFIIYFFHIYDFDFSFLAGVHFLIRELISKHYAQVMTFVLVQFWPISLDICAITAFDGVPSKFDAKTKWKYSHPLKGLFFW